MLNKNKARYFVSIIIILIILLIYKTWFFQNPLSAGDWAYLYDDTISSFSFPLKIWDLGMGSGFGGNVVYLLGLYGFYKFFTLFFFSFFNLSWVIIEKIMWFLPFLGISVFGMYFLSKKILLSFRFAEFSLFLFIANTYSLMMVGGGQMGVALAYSIVPIVLYSFINLINLSSHQILKSRINFRKTLTVGLVFSIQMIFDPRISYIILIAVLIYWIIKQIHVNNFQHLSKSFFITFIIPGFITVLLHFFWMLPLIIIDQNPLSELGPEYSGRIAVEFFSFTRFENTMGLLHSNWPENIFGKVGFMRPEFLLLPILAFSSLLFIKNETKDIKRYVLFFTLIGLLGAFLAKGANDPFGGLYIWLFENFPGFIMFRDPSKWYVLIALSYSMLIPYSLTKIFEYLRLKFPK